MTPSEHTQPLRILFLAAECAPFYKVGGLADVIGALPKALQALGHDVRVIMPHYRLIDSAKFGLKPLDGFLQIPIGGEALFARVARSDFNGRPTYFISDDRILNRAALYGQRDEVQAFVFFCKAAIDLLRAIDWTPDVIHCHDWHISPALLLLALNGDQHLRSIARVFSIHNLAYQGTTGDAILPWAGIDPSIDRIWGEYGDTINWMARGITHADMLNTVSPTYAQEIMTPEYGVKLDPLLRARHLRLAGILNGIDRVEWNPATDAALAAKFSVKSIKRRSINKQAVQQWLGLKIDPHVPVIGIVSRLVEQKGVDILLGAVERLLQRNIQVAILGSGEPRYEVILAQLHQHFPDRIGIEHRFNDHLARLVYGGSDMFLMPSRYEPCGLGQMIAMRYGSIPIVRATGGLKDSVRDADQYPKKGTGFSFDAYSPDALIEAVDRALNAFQERTRWLKIQLRAMAADFSWEVSAEQYEELYRRAIKLRSSIVQ
jgi:starch synthase